MGNERATVSEGEGEGEREHGIQIEKEQSGRDEMKHEGRH